MVSAYTRYELLRAFRNRRFFIFTVAFPLGLYFAIAAPNRNESSLADSGISAPLYFMIGLISFGTMTAMLAARRTNSHRAHPGLEPATPDYAARRLGLFPDEARRRLPDGGPDDRPALPCRDQSRRTTAGIQLDRDDRPDPRRTRPVRRLGVLFGHLFTADSVGAAIGATTGILAFLGGSWFPIDGSGVFHDIAQCFPSYWLVQASRVSIGGHTWGWQGWLVVGVWTAVLTVLAGRAYRRDTKRA
jgi:ABC-2 type transport system permease protein